MPVKLCLIGVGHMGRIHAQKLAQMKDVTLTCIIDANAVQADEISRKHGVRGACHYREALNDGTEAAVIASTTETHYAIARELLDKGIHVFLEKPLAATPQHARELIDLAKKNRVVLQVGHLERFNPPFRRVLKAVDTPFFLEAHRISNFTGRSIDIDVIHDLMIHDIDLALAAAKSEVRKVWAQGMSVLTRKIDVANARIEFANGCTAVLTASRVSSVRERVFTICDKGKYFSLNLGSGKILSASRNSSGKLERYRYTAAHPDAVKDELREFVGAIREKREPLVVGEDGLKALILANQIKSYIEQSSAKKETRAVQ